MLIYNTLSRKKETFTPLKPGKVGLYVCGPTVYGLTHIGNARPAVFFDLVVRFLRFLGNEVRFVVNITDVDDKIIQKANAEKKSCEEISKHYLEEYQKDMGALGVLKPDHQPKVTDHLPQIIALIEKLVEKKMAYVTSSGEVLYRVRRFQGYGKLSGKVLDELQSGSRVEVDPQKEDPLDFSLWKPSKEGEPSWSSPWGEGRPGWHIECSAMAMEYLGETFDIHGGGIDLVHPHHENEIAQSEGATSKPFVKYWMHNHLITMGDEKMSKSLGNLFLTREFVEKHGAEVLRYFLLSSHYRSALNFSPKAIHDSMLGLHRIYTAKARAEKMTSGAASSAELGKFEKSFEANWREYLEDDFNTPKVMALVFDYVRLFNASTQKKGDLGHAKKLNENLAKLGSILGLFERPTLEFLTNMKTKVIQSLGIQESEILSEIQKREEARQQKNYALSDQIRDELLKKGIALSDTPSGTHWDVI